MNIALTIWPLVGVLTLASSACLQPAEAQRFAAIGDYGYASQATSDVAKLVKSWNPEFVITLGDNNYEAGDSLTIDAHIGQYYAAFIYPYRGQYGPGATENRFFPSLGNHDLHTAAGKPYFDYFTLPGNERYYDFVRGNVHFVVLNSNRSEPDGINATSRQAAWCRQRLAASRAPWKVVYFHHPPYSSGQHDAPVMRWPFKEWGASVVLAGHDHLYERFDLGGLPYIVNGLGGYKRFFFRVRLGHLPGSKVRYRGNYGAMQLVATPDALTMQFINRRGKVVDAHTLRKAAASP